MKIFVLSSLPFLLLLSLTRVFSKNLSERGVGEELGHASLPPRGWNSYDSFCWTISEEEFLESADIVSKRLHAHGYEYVVVDYLWYRRKVKGAFVDSLGFDVIDKWGRMQPDPVRWPSSRGGKGFSEVAKKVHGMGLKFGIHVMRGISTQAVNANSVILDITKGRAYEESGRVWRGEDIGIKERACAWMPNGFMSVNTKLGAGRAFLRSLYEQYAQWGVDFVKHDCVFGDDLDIDEITIVSEVLKVLNRPVLYSLSPGTSVTPAMAKRVSGLVNMYRITGDDWDSWGDVVSHFGVSRDFSAARMIGGQGLRGKSWPDLDMLPLGWLTYPGTNEGPHRACNLKLDEQRTQMTLWVMAKSPLMFGGDVRNLDKTTYSLITNPTVLEINSFSSNNMEFPYTMAKKMCTTKSKMEARRRNSLAFALTTCNDPRTTAWSSEGLQQICWNSNLRIDVKKSLCLYKRELLISSDELNDEERYERKHHLLSSNDTDSCLGASSRKKLTSKEHKRGLFSTCRRDANQMWELNGNGTLQNSYSGLCAILNYGKANFVSTGIRSWIATGRRGEIYVAFFNLNSVRTVVSAKISDVAKILPTRNLIGASCKCREVWTGKEFGVTKQSISTTVEVHGTALFVLNCVLRLK